MSSKKPTTKNVIVSPSTGGMALLQQIKALKEEQTRIRETPFKCGSLQLRGKSIKECKSVEELVRMYTEVRMSADGYTQAASELNLTTVKAWNVDGHTLEDIRHDILLRIAILNQAEQEQLINEMEAIAQKYITPEEEQQRDLEKLSEMMSVFKNINAQNKALN